MTGGLAPHLLSVRRLPEGTLAGAREGNEQRKAAESRLGPQI